MKYVPMTLPTKGIEDAITMFVEGVLSDNEFIETIEQAVLSRIEAQGLVIVPREPSRLYFTEATKRGIAYETVAQSAYEAMLEATKDGAE